MEKLPADTIIGIDLGTTNSCAAVAIGAAVKLIPYHGGDTLIPSLFAIDDRGNELVGQDAKRQWQLNPRNTLYATKRLIGRSPRDEVVQTVQQTVQYRVHGGPDRDAVQVGCQGRSLAVHAVAARILAKIRDVASDYLGFKVRRAVVTVPAYFTDRQRQAVKQAGSLIDLDVVRIINEPTAASLAYGVGKRLAERVLVYDLGGGTFDVSIIEIRDRVFEVKATGGDIFLGGFDFDVAVMRYVLETFQRQHGIDLSMDPVAMQRIRDLAERTKIDLSSRTEAPFSVPFITTSAQGHPLNLEVRFTRALLEQLTALLVDRTVTLVKQVLADTGLGPGDIEEVLLVGGQTRMPLVQQRLTELFGKPPSRGVHPDEAVAVGAALYAWSLHDDSDLKVQLLDVIPMAIGIETASGTLHTVFPRNAPVPNAKVLEATSSVDDQSELVVRVRQGDQPRAAENELLGELTFSGVRPGPAGAVRLEMVFEVNGEGILSVRARDAATGHEMRKTIRVAER